MKQRSSQHWWRGDWGAQAWDVFTNVPSDLWSMEQVVLQPHRTSATQETRADMGDVLVANRAAHFAGEVPPAAIA